MKPLLVYLHGLNSSSQSYKAIATQKYVEQIQGNIELWVPDLPIFPSDIVQYLQCYLEQFVNQRAIYIIGSSLGGYLGTWLQDWLLEKGHQHNVRLVLVNPAVIPYEHFEEYLGPQKNHHTGAKWVMTEEYVEQLIQLEVRQLKVSEGVFLLVQTGDEVLDYQQSVKKYSQCKMLIQKGGSHGFDNFETLLPDIFDFMAIV